MTAIAYAPTAPRPRPATHPKQTMLDHALAYARRGLSVIPLVPRGKKPHSSILPQMCHWPRRSGDDGSGKGTWLNAQYRPATEDEIRQWWTESTDANIGIVTGAVSGVVVLDRDSVDGFDALATLGGLPDVPTATTANGEHYYFAHPGSYTPNWQKRYPGLDLRGDGGYVVAPPSLHPSGAVYTWVHKAPLPPCPEWATTADATPHTPPTEKTAQPVPASATADMRANAQRWLDRECSRLAECPDGIKHPELLKSAKLLGGLVPIGALDEHEIADALLRVIAGRAKNIGTARRTIRDGIAYGEREPIDPALLAPPKPQPIYNDHRQACCPTHQRPLSKARNGNGWCCRAKDASGPRGYCTFWWAGDGYSDPLAVPDEAEAQRRRQQDAQRKRKEYDMDKAARAARINAQLGEIAERAIRDKRLRSIHLDILEVQLRVARGRGWHRISIPRMAAESKHHADTVRRVQADLESWGYFTRDEQLGHTTRVTFVMEKDPSSLEKDQYGYIDTVPSEVRDTSINIYTDSSDMAYSRFSGVVDQPGSQNDDADLASLLATAPACEGDDDPAGWEWDKANEAQQPAPVAVQPAPTPPTESTAQPQTAQAPTPRPRRVVKQLGPLVAEALDANPGAPLRVILHYVRANGYPDADEGDVAEARTQIKTGRQHAKRRNEYRAKLAKMTTRAEFNRHARGLAAALNEAYQLGYQQQPARYERGPDGRRYVVQPAKLPLWLLLERSAILAREEARRDAKQAEVAARVDETERLDLWAALDAARPAGPAVGIGRAAIVRQEEQYEADCDVAERPAFDGRGTGSTATVCIRAESGIATAARSHRGSDPRSADAATMGEYGHDEQEAAIADIDPASAGADQRANLFAAIRRLQEAQAA
jgi:hypothetical protein